MAGRMEWCAANKLAAAGIHPGRGPRRHEQPGQGEV